MTDSLSVFLASVDVEPQSAEVLKHAAETLQRAKYKSATDLVDAQYTDVPVEHLPVCDELPAVKSFLRRAFRKANAASAVVPSPQVTPQPASSAAGTTPKPSKTVNVLAEIARREVRLCAEVVPPQHCVDTLVLEGDDTSACPVTRADSLGRSRDIRVG